MIFFAAQKNFPRTSTHKILSVWIHEHSLQNLQTTLQFYTSLLQKDYKYNLGIIIVIFSGFAISSSKLMFKELSCIIDSFNFKFDVFNLFLEPRLIFYLPNPEIIYITKNKFYQRMSVLNGKFPSMSSIYVKRKLW